MRAARHPIDAAVRRLLGTARSEAAQAEAAWARSRAAFEEAADLLDPRPAAEDVALFRAIRDPFENPGEVFAAASVIRLAKTTPTLADYLAAVIGDDPENQAFRLGLWLRRMIGVEIDGLCVRRVESNDDKNSGVWTIDLPDRE